MRCVLKNDFYWFIPSHSIWNEKNEIDCDKNEYGSNKAKIDDSIAYVQ